MLMREHSYNRGTNTVIVLLYTHYTTIVVVDDDGDLCIIINDVGPKTNKYIFR